MTSHSHYSHQRTDLICDFCNTPNPYWAYPVDDFDQVIGGASKNLTWGSKGGWSACDACHELIEANKRHELAIRCIAHFEDVKSLSGDGLRQLYQRLRVLHDEFYAMRSGPAVPETEFDDGENTPGLTTYEEW